MLRRYVLTGTPGAGKTVLGHALRQRGYAVVPEAATDVIAGEQARGVDEPWQREDFCDKIVLLQRQRQTEPPAGQIGVQVYDRSPLCTLALARYLARPVTPLLAEEVARVVEERVYEHSVFFVRPLGFVVSTSARRISYPESLRFEAVHEQVYREHGYQLVDVPAGAITERAAAIDTYIKQRGEAMTHPGGAQPAIPAVAQRGRRCLFGRLVPGAGK
ncbi:MAG: AAA family ATPase [Pseudonocardiaceae bacterium]